MMNDETTEDNNEEDKSRLISMRQAADIYGFTQHYLTRLARKGRMKAQKIDTFWVTTPNDVEKFIASRQKKGVYRDDIETND